MATMNTIVTALVDGISADHTVTISLEDWNAYGAGAVIAALKDRLAGHEVQPQSIELPDGEVLTQF